MAYSGDGSYLRELAEEHRQGRHDDKIDSLCQMCHKPLVLTKEELDRLNEPDPVLEAAADAVFLEEHARGEHAKYPSQHCIHDECRYWTEKIN